ncbi:unnamed protein product [Blepharisma stoltei]|uniref:Protein kinase domain-containing protein n=1 Tax=Blepharisma stoltei TaxID=1481888 RepID=A0AAU9IHA3_9CILI|nr:unnamed protein product [Blepharisma stoltei]
MLSIFALFDQPGNLDFWSDLSNSNCTVNSSILIKGFLTELTPKNTFKERYYCLSNFSFLRAKTDNQPFTKVSSLKWKVIEPFIEEGSKSKKYGFRVTQGALCRHFYTNFPDDLDNWLTCLSKIGIMTDIKNDYDFKKVLGAGTFAQVYLATQVETSQDYAVKSIEKALIQTKKNFLLLVNEIEILRTLNHPNIIKLHGIYESEHHVHMVLDYAQGGDLLHRILNKGPLTEENAAKLMRNLLKVLEYLQTKNVVHRDIKLENILFVSDNNDYKIKLSDFGLACFIDADLTQSCGSPGYVAPEILKRRPYGSKVDIFSAGVVLYILLSGRAPFSGKTQKETLIRNRDCSILFPKEFWKNISRQAIDAILFLARSQPKMRPNAKEALGCEWFKKYFPNINAMRKTASLSNLQVQLLTKFEVSVKEIIKQRRHSCFESNSKIKKPLEKSASFKRNIVSKP